MCEPRGSVGSGHGRRMDETGAPRRARGPDRLGCRRASCLYFTRLIPFDVGVVTLNPAANVAAAGGRDRGGRVLRAERR